MTLTIKPPQNGSDLNAKYKTVILPEDKITENLGDLGFDANFRYNTKGSKTSWTSLKLVISVPWKKLSWEWKDKLLGQRLGENICKIKHSYPKHKNERKSKWSCLVTSDSLQPHRLECTRFLHPWDFPRKSMEWVAITFSSGSYPPRDQSQVSHIVGRRFTICVTRDSSNSTVRKQPDKKIGKKPEETPHQKGLTSSNKPLEKMFNITSH